MESRFIFREDDCPELAEYGRKAEECITSDPNICLLCLGRIAASRIIKPDIKITREHGLFFKKGKTAQIDEKSCIGCGSCVNLCPPGAITLEREIGPIIKIKELKMDNETCVECFMCEDNCPTEAIKIIDGNICLDDDKGILCDVCSAKCPVEALKLECVNNES